MPERGEKHVMRPGRARVRALLLSAAFGVSLCRSPGLLNGNLAVASVIAPLLAMVALPDLVLAAGSPCPSFLFQLCFLARMAMVWVSWPFLKETLSYNGCLSMFVFMDVLPVLSSQLQLQTHMILEAAYSLSWLPIFVATSQRPITWQVCRVGLSWFVRIFLWRALTDSQPVTVSSCATRLLASWGCGSGSSSSSLQDGQACDRNSSSRGGPWEGQGCSRSHSCCSSSDGSSSSSTCVPGGQGVPGAAKVQRCLPSSLQAQQPHNALEATTLQLPFAAADDATWLHYRSPLGCVKQAAVKINTHHRVEDLPPDTPARINALLAKVAQRSGTAPWVVLRWSARSGCVQLVLELGSGQASTSASAQHQLWDAELRDAINAELMATLGFTGAVSGGTRRGSMASRLSREGLRGLDPPPPTLRPLVQTQLVQRHAVAASQPVGSPRRSSSGSRMDDCGSAAPGSSRGSCSSGGGGMGDLQLLNSPPACDASFGMLLPVTSCPEWDEEAVWAGPAPCPCPCTEQGMMQLSLIVPVVHDQGWAVEGHQLLAPGLHHVWAEPAAGAGVPCLHLLAHLGGNYCTTRVVSAGAGGLAQEAQDSCLYQVTLCVQPQWLCPQGGCQVVNLELWHQGQLQDTATMRLTTPLTPNASVRDTLAAKLKPRAAQRPSDAALLPASASASNSGTAAGGAAAARTPGLGVAAGGPGTAPPDFTLFMRDLGIWFGLLADSATGRGSGAPQPLQQLAQPLLFYAVRHGLHAVAADIMDSLQGCVAAQLLGRQPGAPLLDASQHQQLLRLAACSASPDTQRLVADWHWAGTPAGPMAPGALAGSTSGSSPCGVAREDIPVAGEGAGEGAGDGAGEGAGPSTRVREGEGGGGGAAPGPAAGLCPGLKRHNSRLLRMLQTAAHLPPAVGTVAQGGGAGGPAGSGDARHRAAPAPTLTPPEPASDLPSSLANAPMPDNTAAALAQAPLPSHAADHHTGQGVRLQTSCMPARRVPHQRLLELLPATDAAMTATISRTASQPLSTDSLPLGRRATPVVPLLIPPLTPYLTPSNSTKCHTPRQPGQTALLESLGSLSDLSHFEPCKSHSRSPHARHALRRTAMQLLGAVLGGFPSAAQEHAYAQHCQRSARPFLRIWLPISLLHLLSTAAHAPSTKGCAVMVVGATMACILAHRILGMKGAKASPLPTPPAAKAVAKSGAGLAAWEDRRLPGAGQGSKEREAAQPSQVAAPAQALSARPSPEQQQLVPVAGAAVIGGGEPAAVAAGGGGGGAAGAAELWSPAGWQGVEWAVCVMPSCLLLLCGLEAAGLLEFSNWQRAGRYSAWRLPMLGVALGQAVGGQVRAPAALLRAGLSCLYSAHLFWACSRSTHQLWQVMVCPAVSLGTALLLDASRRHHFVQSRHEKQQG